MVGRYSMGSIIAFFVVIAVFLWIDLYIIFFSEPFRFNIHNGGNCMEISNGVYTLRFESGGVEVIKNRRTLYFNKRPVYKTINYLDHSNL